MPLIAGTRPAVLIFTGSVRRPALHANGHCGIAHDASQSSGNLADLTLDPGLRPEQPVRTVRQDRLTCG